MCICISDNNHNNALARAVRRRARWRCSAQGSSQDLATILHYNKYSIPLHSMLCHNIIVCIVIDDIIV